MNIFKSLIWDNLVTAMIAELFIAVPFLNIWPVNWLISNFVTMITNKVFVLLDKVVNLEVIMIKDEILRGKFVDASIELKGIATQHGVDSDEFKQARENHKTALSHFVRFSPDPMH